MTDKTQVAPEDRPGQVIRPEELPDPEVQRAHGIDPEQYKAGLVILGEDVARDIAEEPLPSAPDAF